jgi:hypothetical protein
MRVVVMLMPMRGLRRTLIARRARLHRFLSERLGAGASVVQHQAACRDYRDTQQPIFHARPHFDTLYHY